LALLYLTHRFLSASFSISLSSPVETFLLRFALSISRLPVIRTSCEGSSADSERADASAGRLRMLRYSIVPSPLQRTGSRFIKRASLCVVCEYRLTCRPGMPGHLAKVLFIRLPMALGAGFKLKDKEKEKERDREKEKEKEKDRD
ncbi:hypothetical protein EW146_g9896, partial [Bondarzewia mesenterica]